MRHEVFALVALFGLVASALGAFTAWLAWGRFEWRIGSERLVRQKRFRDRLREDFEAASLELSVSRDSDGDEWFTLDALAPGVASEPPLAFGYRPRRRGRRTLSRSMNDDSDPRRAGAWFARRAGLPLVDRTTDEARRGDVATVRIQLDPSSRLGRLAARVVERLERERPPRV